MNPFVKPLAALVFLIAPAALAAEPEVIRDIAYHSADRPVDDPRNRCLLDLRLPAERNGFATLVWFHGGGLTGGAREFPAFAGENVALVGAGYRLSPQAKPEDFLTDAAAAVAWTLRGIAGRGGDAKKVFVGGHSAGGWLAAMIGMEPKWLAAHGFSNKQLAGIIPASAQATSHFHIKELRGIKTDPLVPVIDSFAPLAHVSRDLPPICLILGDRRIEWPCRVEENELLAATLKRLGHPDVEFHELAGLDHGTVANGAADIMPAYIKRITSGEKTGPPAETIRPFIDDTAPGFRELTAADFAKVNSADDTWQWRDGMLVCTGQPLSVMRTVKEYRNFEMVVEWSHQQAAGNSGLFVWVTPESVGRLTNEGKPGLPSGIEVQMLDHGYTEKIKAAGKPTDWFGTNGDVFAVGVKMTPFPPLSPDGSRSFPRKRLAKGHGEWNHYHVRAINGEVRLWVNGEEVSGGTNCDPAQGYLCLESEGSPIHFRKLRIRELP